MLNSWCSGFVRQVWHKSGPWDEGMKWSTLGVRRSKAMVT